jgi:hypothetical protein
MNRIWASLFVGTLIDVAIVWVALKLTSNEFEWSAVFWWWLIFSGLAFVVWLRKTIGWFFVYWLWGREDLTNAVFNRLVENDFPEYPEWGSLEWFESLKNDSEVMPNVRVAASGFVGEWQGVKTFSPLMAMRINRCMDRAAGRYNGFLKLRSQRHFAS